MSDIKFAKDYGYPPATPFWLVWNEDGRPPMFKHPTREDAEIEAARLAREAPWRNFHVLSVMSTISTNVDVVGTRFDPTRTPAPQAVEVDAPQLPAFIEPAPSPDDEVAF